MSTNIADIIIYKVRKYGIKRISFFGGEPLLNWDMVCYIINNCEKQNIPVKYGLITNGVLLNKEKIQYLKIHGVDLAISFDGNNHNNYRGKTEIVYSTILLASKIIDNLTICPVICKDNIIGFADDMIDLYERGVNRILPSLNEKDCQWIPEDFIELRGEFNKIATYIARQRRLGQYKKFGAFDAIYHSIINNTRKPNCSNCHFCKDNYVVDTDGSIYPCVLFADDNNNCIGNIAGTIDNEKISNLMRNYSKKIYAECESCEYSWFCHNTCACQNYVKHNYSQYTTCDYIKMNFGVISEIIDMLNNGLLQ